MSRVVTFAALFIFSMSVFAQTEPPQFFTLDGRLFNAGSDTDPLLDSNISMTIQVLDPAKTCVLYEEQQNISTLATNGYFSVRVGSAIGSPKRTGNDVGNSLAALFYNSGVAISGDGGCNYTPAAGDERYFRFFITPSTVGATSQLSPDMSLDSVPQAIVAQTLQGLGPTDVFRTSVTSTQAKLDNLLTTNYTALTDLVGGASTLYLPSTAEGTQLPSTAADPVAPVAGQVWYNSTSNELKYFNGSVVETLTSGGAGGTVTSVATGAGLTGGPITASGTISIANSGVINAMLATGIDASKVTVGTLPAGVVPTGTDDTKLPLLGGTMTGALDMGAQNVLNTGHITMNALRTITIGRFTAAEQAALVGTLGAPNAGATWFNSDTGKLMYWTGAAAREVSEMTTAGGDITSVVAGTGLTGGALTGAATLNVDIGTSAGQLFTIDSVPPCSATQKLQMSSGPIYLWSCENEAVPSLVADADSDTRIRTEAAADEDVLRFDTAGSERMVIGATGNVGIGTTAPLSKLDVNGGVAIGTFAGTAAAPSNGLSVSGAVRFGQETGVSNIYNQYTGLFTYVPKMQVSGTISDSASILLASSQLNVAGPNMVFAHSRGLTAGAQGVLQTGDELGVLNFQGSDGTNFLSSSRISSNVVGTPAAGDLASELRFLTRPVGGNISQRMVIASDGNVGIGTTAPTSALNIFSTVYPPLKSERSVATVATKTTSALFQTTTSADMVDNFGTQIDFGIKDTSGVDNKLASIGALRRGADNTGAMIFETSVAGTANERMRISESGNIGIGTTDPSVSLDLNTKTDAVRLPAGTDAERPAAANGMIRYNTTSNKFEGYENGAWVGLREAASGTVVAAGNGAVGAPSLSFSGDPNTGFYSNGADVLGVTTNGVNRFNISSAGLVSSTTGGGLVTSGNGTAAAPTFSFAGDPDTGWWRPAADTMAASTAGVERMRIDANGNIGVGTTAPTVGTLLHMHMATGWTTHRISSGDSGTEVMFNSNGSTGLDGTITYEPNKQMRFFTDRLANGAADLVINSTGEVGIGTISPLSTLHIKKPTTAGVGVLVQGGTSNTNDHMQWQSSAGAVQGVIDYNGQVGLGTTTPLSPLHVYSTTASSLTFERSTAANANIQYKNTVGSMYAGLSPTAFFGVGNTSDLAGASFAVLPSGNVGIGTTAPSARLHSVASGSATDGVLVTASTGSGVVRLRQTSANHGSINASNAAGTETIALNSGGDSFINGGNVGIGTSSPQAPLHVAGNIRLNGPDLNLYNSVRCQSDVTDSLGYCDGTGRAFAHEAGDVLHINFSNDFDGGLRFNGGGAQMLGGNFYLGGGPYTVNNSYTLGQSSSRFQLSGVDAHGSGMSGLSFQNSGAGPNITLGHSRGGTIGTQAILNSGDELGAVSFQGSDGTKFIEGAKIYSVVSGASALDNLAADIRFQTRAAGGSGVATRMTIGTSGNVGIGTTNPTANLTVSGDSPTFNMDGYWTGNGPVLVGRRARGTVSVPLATQVGDQLLFVGGRGYGDTAFASASSAAIVFSAGENFTDTAQGANISFATTPLGAPNTSRVERMRITESGNVGIGTTTPGNKLEVVSTTNAESTVRISRTDDTLHRNELQFKPAAALSATNVAWLLGQSVNTDTFHVKSWDGTTATHRFVLDRDGNVGIGTSTPSQKLHVVGNLRVQGSTDCTLGNGAGGTNCSSDRRLKTNIRPIQNVIDKILSITGVEFEWNEKSNSPGDSAIGVIAQDVEKQFPTAVIEDAGSGYKKVDYAVLVAPLIEAFKNLHTKILELFKLSELQSRQIASLKQQTTTDSAAKDHQIAKLKAEIEKQKNETAVLKKYLCSKDPQAALCKQ